jgi:hypothetical protein
MKVTLGAAVVLALASVHCGTSREAKVTVVDPPSSALAERPAPRVEVASMSVEVATPSPAANAADAAADELDSVQVDIAPEEGTTLRGAVAEEAARAKGLGMKPFLYVHAAWCKPCVKLEHSMVDPRMRDATRKAYIIKADLDAFSDAEWKAFGKKVAVVPTFIALDDKGHPTWRTIDGRAWKEDTIANMAPALDRFFHAG